MIHTPKQSERNFKELQKHLKGFVDTSYINDECDSIYNEEREIAIYFPNSDKDDEHDKWSTYGIDYYAVVDGKMTNLMSDPINSIEEVVKYINSIETNI